MARIRVSVSLTVEVDVDEWKSDYGDDVDVRRDVRSFAADSVLYANPAIKSVSIQTRKGGLG